MKPATDFARVMGCQVDWFYEDSVGCKTQFTRLRSIGDHTNARPGLAPLPAGNGA